MPEVPIIVVDTDKNTLQDQYDQALVDLDLIQSTDLNNNAKLQSAIKASSEIIESLLKVVRRRL